MPIVPFVECRTYRDHSIVTPNHCGECFIHCAIMPDHQCSPDDRSGMKYRRAVDIIHLQDIAKASRQVRCRVTIVFLQDIGYSRVARARHAPQPIEQMQPRPFARLVIDLALQMLGELLR